MKLFYKLFILLTLVKISADKCNAQCIANFNVVNNQTNGVVTFQDSSIYTGQYVNLLWDLGDGSTSMSQGFTHTYAAGTYNVCLTIMDSLNPSCTSTFCDSVIVVDSTAICYASFSIQDTTSGFEFVANVGGNATNYLWNFDDGTTSTSLTPPPHTFPGYGSYFVCFTASNPSTACSVTYCDSIIISSCTALPSYIQDNLGNGVQFSANSNGNVDTYLWDFGDGNTSSLANPHHTYSSIGSFYTCLTVSSSTDTSCYYTKCIYTSLYDNTPCNANFTVVQDTLNLNHFWILNSSTNSSNYIWDFGDGDTSSLQFPTHTYATSGPYNICLSVSSYNNCADTICDSVYGGRSSQMTITVIDPATVGIKEIPGNEVNLNNHPNPFGQNTTINYSISTPTELELSIYDLLGNKIRQLEKSNKPAGNYNLVWNTEGVAEGLYILQLNTSRHKASKKIVITR